MTKSFARCRNALIDNNITLAKLFVDMSCFIAPLVQAMATSACKKGLANRSDSKFVANLPTLEKMLWGGSLVLIVDHIAHGELFTFNLHELLVVGIPMCAVVTAAWLLLTLKKKNIVFGHTENIN